MSQEILEAIGEQIGGTEITYGPVLTRLRAKVPAAWRLWRHKNSRWAIFVLASRTLSAVDADSIRQASPNNLRTLLVVPEYEGLAAAASIYREVAPYVLYPIAGKLTLIPPPTLAPMAPTPVASPSRCPLDMLDSVAALTGLPAGLTKALGGLAKSYGKLLKADRCTDELEEGALLGFARDVLTQMGLNPAHIRATAMIRTLERDQLGTGRDHFFHSFQNYFLGLTAVAQLRDEFLSFKAAAKVNWEVEPADVWFLTALWHDVGYAAQKFDNVYNAAFGDEEDDESKEIKNEAINRMLDRAAAKKGIRAMASLMARLLKPKDAKTEWSEPG